MVSKNMNYEYVQKSPRTLFKRVPKCEEDHMRICGSYTDELEYSGKVGMEEAIKAGCKTKGEFIKYVMHMYRGHMSFPILEEMIDNHLTEVKQ